MFMPVASRPNWLSKPGVLAFGSLRSYPLGQLRRLCVALHEGNLPLKEPAVQALVQQTIYHLGELTDCAEPRRLWRTGWEDDVAAALCRELDQWADKLQDTPREHEAVLLLGEVSSTLC